MLKRLAGSASAKLRAAQRRPDDVSQQPREQAPDSLSDPRRLREHWLADLSKFSDEFTTAAKGAAA